MFVGMRPTFAMLGQDHAQDVPGRRHRTRAMLRRVSPPLDVHKGGHLIPSELYLVETPDSVGRLRRTLTPVRQEEGDERIESGPADLGTPEDGPNDNRIKELTVPQVAVGECGFHQNRLSEVGSLEVGEVAHRAPKAGCPEDRTLRLSVEEFRESQVRLGEVAVVESGVAEARVPEIRLDEGAIMERAVVEARAFEISVREDATMKARPLEVAIRHHGLLETSTPDIEDLDLLVGDLQESPGLSLAGQPQIVLPQLFRDVHHSTTPARRPEIKAASLVSAP